MPLYLPSQISPGPFVGFCGSCRSSTDTTDRARGICAPVATKRALRAILKATDLCASDPAVVGRQLLDGGFTSRYDYALQTLSENSYDKWREYDPEDMLRFYTLRLRDVRFIKSSPQKIIADNTDWRFPKRAQTRAEGVSGTKDFRCR
jgi:NitT/TauT family transport system substrate-binding protein